MGKLPRERVLQSRRSPRCSLSGPFASGLAVQGRAEAGQICLDHLGHDQDVLVSDLEEGLGPEDVGPRRSPVSLAALAVAASLDTGAGREGLGDAEVSLLFDLNLVGDDDLSCGQCQSLLAIIRRQGRLGDFNTRKVLVEVIPQIAVNFEEVVVLGAGAHELPQRGKVRGATRGVALTRVSW